MEKAVAEGVVRAGHVAVGGFIHNLTDDTGGSFQYYENSTIMHGTGLKR